MLQYPLSRHLKCARVQTVCSRGMHISMMRHGKFIKSKTRKEKILTAFPMHVWVPILYWQSCPTLGAKRTAVPYSDGCVFFTKQACNGFHLKTFTILWPFQQKTITGCPCKMPWPDDFATWFLYMCLPKWSFCWMPWPDHFPTRAFHFFTSVSQSPTCTFWAKPVYVRGVRSAGCLGLMIHMVSVLDALAGWFCSTCVCRYDFVPS